MKRIISLMLMSAMMMALSFTGTFVAAADPVSHPQIGSISGTVTEISDFFDQGNMVVANKKFVLVTDHNDGISYFVMDTDTYFITGKGLSELRVGDIFTGFYDATLPMIAIYPPQYHPIAVAVNPPVDTYFIKVDKFDGDLISSDSQLKLIPSEETKILTRDGDAYGGALPGLTLAVIYHVSTKSLPAQTKPSKIIVLEGFLPMEGDILVMDTLLDTRDFYIFHQGNKRIVMVPFRAISEELGYTVTCKGDTVFLGPYNTFTFSQDSYAFAHRAPIELGTAPYLLDGVSYVPITYFKQVLKLNNAYNFEGQIVIDNNEIIH